MEIDGGHRIFRRTTRFQNVVVKQTRFFWPLFALFGFTNWFNFFFTLHGTVSDIISLSGSLVVMIRIGWIPAFFYPNTRSQYPTLFDTYTKVLDTHFLMNRIALIFLFFNRCVCWRVTMVMVSLSNTFIKI